MRPVKKPLLTNPQKRKRYEWACKYRSWTSEDWKKVIFSDETTIEVQLAQPRLVRKGSEPLSPLHMSQRIKMPQKVMIWGCMSHYGFGRLHVVEGTMNSSKYINVLSNRMKPQADAWYNGSQYIFQQDNAPCHTARTVKSFMAQQDIEILDWPSSSPDMNPIETLWAVIKQKLREKSLTSRQMLINELLNICTRDGEVRDRLTETCTKLVEAMPKRVDTLYKARGGHTKY